LTINSGAEVPKATMVKPITIDDIFNFLAMDDEPSTNRFAPEIRSTKPITNKM
jgi:hypothetical protein